MQKFTTLTGLVVPIDRANVDTDAIMPKQFLKSIKRTGFGPNLFDEWRYLDRGEPGQDSAERPRKPDFALNQPRYQGVQIMLCRENLGCGSSREHAVWALDDYGIRALIAPSYADIFFSNCLKNGVLPITLPADAVDKLFQETHAQEGYRLTIDLAEQSVTTPGGDKLRFDLDASWRQRLLEGLDDIALSLQQADKIRDYEQRRRAEAPWLFF